MDFLKAMRMKHGKQSGNMAEADSYFAGLGTSKFRAIGKQISKAGKGIKKKPLRFGERPRPSIGPGF